MNKIAIVTATRAEYGLLSPLIKELRNRECEDLVICLVVTGTHLSDRYGRTIEEISERIDFQIQISIDSESEEDISSNQADALAKFTKLFISERFDAVVLLGDRYETLAIAIAAGNTRTPIFHLCGGDTTEGAIDEWIRHCITKISYLHFVTNEESMKRVIQLGEDPSRVFNFGSTSVDNMLTIADMTKKEALESIGLFECRYAICTYHPVTMESGNVCNQIEELLQVIKSFPDLQFIMTKSNADHGGEKINKLLDAAELKIDNLHVYSSLGARRYLSLMKYAEFVLGNSSSGIIEAPLFHIPTINIGDRQKGRLRAESIIDCGIKANEIVSAIRKAMTKEHQKVCESVLSPYGNGNSAMRIADKIVEIVLKGNIDLKKRFYDIYQ